MSETELDPAAAFQALTAAVQTVVDEVAQLDNKRALADLTTSVDRMRAAVLKTTKAAQAEIAEAALSRVEAHKTALQFGETVERATKGINQVLTRAAQAKNQAGGQGWKIAAMAGLVAVGFAGGMVAGVRAYPVALIATQPGCAVAGGQYGQAQQGRPAFCVFWNK